MINAVINGTGSYLPKHVLTNQELEKTIDTSHEWIFSRSGISNRHIAESHETTAFMAAEAAKDALTHSTVNADDIDLILVATCTPSSFFPSMACYVQHALGIKKSIPAFDISAACSGFIYALDTAWKYIKSGSVKHVLVIGSETMSKAVNWQDRSSCVLFGDGSGALVLSADQANQGGIIASKLHAAYDSDLLLNFENYTNQDIKSSITMRGNEVFKIAVNMMGDIVDEILEEAHLNRSDINWLIPHQANIRIIQAIAKKLNLPMSNVIVTIEDQGNTSAASIPLALDFSVKNKRVKRGDTLLMEAFGGGMTWGAMIVRY